MVSSAKQELSWSECLHLCRFSAAGNDDLTMRSDDRRPKSAKARNRVERWCADGAAKVRTKRDGSRSVDSIFDAFVTAKSHGMGLGLAICSTIIEQHGGKLTASSDGKSGALFQVSLPIEPAGQAPQPA